MIQGSATTMIQLEFRFEDREALAQGRFEQPHPHVQRKMEALWLKSLALSHGLICQICGISGNPLREYFRDYQQGGIARLKEVRFYRPASALAPTRTSVEEALRQQPQREGSGGSDRGPDGRVPRTDQTV